MYGIYLNDHKEYRTIGLEEINGQLYSRNTLGEFKVKRLREEFIGFIPESLITDYIAIKSNNRNTYCSCCKTAIDLKQEKVKHEKCPFSAKPIKNLTIECAAIEFKKLRKYDFPKLNEIISIFKDSLGKYYLVIETDALIGWNKIILFIEDIQEYLSSKLNCTVVIDE